MKHDAWIPIEMSCFRDWQQLKETFAISSSGIKQRQFVQVTLSDK
jgi:ribulose 1,5-bisphosphate carboxylase large subunit-like protein